MPVNNRFDLLGKRRSYAFVIGINAYPEINRDLSSAVYDAKEVARTFRNEQGFDHVELFLAPKQEDDADALAQDLDGIQYHDKADAATLRDLLARIQDPAQEPKIDSNDCIVFYYAGHGKPGKFDEGPAGYLLPSDALPEAAMLSKESLIPMEDVYDTLKELDCHHTLLILDCCFAGKFRFVGQGRSSEWDTDDLPLYHKRFNRFVNGKAWQVLVSAGPHQPAADWVGVRFDDGQIHSPFAEALIKALRGEAQVDYREEGRRLGDGVLTSGELKNYLWDVVERLTNEGEDDMDIQYPDLFPMGQHKGGQFIFFDPEVALKFADFKQRNPYKGLQTYGLGDADIFFGRKTVIRDLVPRIREHPTLVITGPSASGKSSLVKAGLFPGLCQKNESWQAEELLILRPGAKPWSGPAATDEETGDFLHDTGLQEVQAKLDPEKGQVLLLDQFEELYTEGASTEERDRFEQEMIQLLSKAKEQQLRIVITLRSDYEWQLQESVFGQAFWKQDQLYTFLYRLPAMNIDELREALVKPALAELYDFETDYLITTILDEIGHAPGALPLLNFTMSRLYQITNEELRVFTHQDYHDLGGVNGALSQYADEVYQSLSVAQQEVMQKLLLRMVKLVDGGYGRRRVYVQPGPYFTHNRRRSFVNEFDYPDHQDQLVADVLDLLAEKQLIIGGRDIIGSYFEPVHDSLIQHWKLARQWIKDFGSEYLTLQRQLWEAVLDSTAKSEQEEKKQKDSLVQFSKLWDSNPKLVQVIEHVAQAAKPVLLQKKDEVLAEAIVDMPLEEVGAFSEFWKECTEAEDIPDLNTLVLSGYSDDLLDIMLLHGPHWLNEAEVSFIKQSWSRRIQSILELKAQQERVVREMMSSTWRAGTFLDEKDFGYWQGVRDTYSSIKILMDLKKVRSISPVPVFLKGPHTDEFDQQSREFGHYNPKFLDWLKTYAIPAEQDIVLLSLTMPFYKKIIQPKVRIFYNVYKYHEKNAHILPKLVEKYQEEKAKNPEADINTAQFYRGGLFGDVPEFNQIEMPEERKFSEEIHDNVAAAFWLRRTMDGTIIHFRDILIKLLRTYDPQWLDATDQIWTDAEAYRLKQAARGKEVGEQIADALQRASDQPNTRSILDNPFLDNLFHHFSHLFNLSKLQSWSPVPVFIQGPHTTSFNFNALNFGHYNPEFVNWLKGQVERGLNTTALRRIMGLFYQNIARTLARIHHKSWQYLMAHPEEHKELTDTYHTVIKDHLSAGQAYDPGISALLYSTPLDSIMRKVESEFQQAYGFWLRRSMDGTAEQFFEILNLLVQAFDGDWLAEVQL